MRRARNANTVQAGGTGGSRHSRVVVCSGMLLGLWIAVGVVFVTRRFDDAARRFEASNRRSGGARLSGTQVVDRQDRLGAAAASAPQALLKNASKDALDETLRRKSASQFSNVERQAAAVSLVQRVVGEEVAASFSVTVTGKSSLLDSFEIRDIPLDLHTNRGIAPRIRLTGTNGVAVASALNFYLRYFCKVDTSWMSPLPLKLPEELPAVGTPVKRTSFVRYSYYENVCTHSYTQAFWTWSRWQREIDWMAMHGINLPLALTGQEAVSQRVFLKLGLTHADIGSYFAGPAFLAWNRMLNIKACTTEACGMYGHARV